MKDNAIRLQMFTTFDDFYSILFRLKIDIDAMINYKQQKSCSSPKISLLPFWNSSSLVTYENNKHKSNKHIHEYTAMEKV